ncbi:LacI family DNA-binding transcriptional regulator [Tranquillimonas alkanivorans]|uniref:Transcriptional regulator, LacI family n=1 Tax=Tranquillimonas alkanivorans TaxID=441119 RepID=A0A1I5VUL4_9RHOB|nr:LacI family DNA-binding transcriptional regulator [Tranquillimonas alkanivorans]SFQ11238.1 transcriptional regulator, LacI family [Tranquillimonas alkanivorans]
MPPMSETQDRMRPAKAGRNGKSRVTMEAVGRLAGVSQVTVSRALSDPSKVSPKTLEKIREAIEVTGFVPNALAGALASSKSKLVTALVPSITNIVYSTMVNAFGEEMRREGYQILLSSTGVSLEEEEALIATHLSRRPDAVLLTGIHHSPQARKMLLGAGIPVVEVWDTTDSPIDLCVGFSHVAAGRAVADFAADAGYASAGTVSAGDERALRRKAAFADQFLRRTGSEVAQVDFDDAASLANGREGLRRLIDEQEFTRGVIFCSSDLLAHGVLIEAQARGLSTLRDIAVIGFGDQDFAPYTEPALTTVRVDRAALGFTAARALLDRFEGRNPPQPVTDLGFEIVRRRSA